MQQISKFWGWFDAARSEIIAAVESKNDDWLRRELTPRVTRLQLPNERPRLNWEIGPGISKKWRFSLSPMVKNNLPLSKEIVAQAPSYDDWEFYSAKPPKRDVFIYQLRDEEGELLNVDVTHWEYALRSYEGDGRVDVLLLPDTLPEIELQNRKKLGYLIVEGLLGEQAFIERVADVEVLSPGSAGEWPKSRLRLLEKHLASFVAG